MTALLLIFKYLPVILQAIMAVEGAIGAGNGATKKQIVLAAIQAAAKVGETVDQKTVTMLSSLVDEIVGLLNASGIFGHAPAPAA